MINQFCVNYHDALDESKLIEVDTKVFADGMWSVRIGDMSVFMNPSRAAQLRDAINGALESTKVDAA